MDKKKVGAILAAVGTMVGAAVGATGCSDADQAKIAAETATCRTELVEIIDDTINGIFEGDNYVAMNVTREQWDCDKAGKVIGEKELVFGQKALSADSSMASYRYTANSLGGVYRLYSSSSAAGQCLVVGADNSVSSYTDKMDPLSSIDRSKSDLDGVVSRLTYVQEVVNMDDMTWTKTDGGYQGNGYITYLGRRCTSNIDVNDGKITGVNISTAVSSIPTMTEFKFAFKYLSQEDYNSALQEMQSVVANYTVSYTPSTGSSTARR